MNWQVEYYKKENGDIDNTFILLNGYTKKANKIPKTELDRAIRYKKDYERRCDNE